jgi:hypothetical protein
MNVKDAERPKLTSLQGFMGCHAQNKRAFCPILSCDRDQHKNLRSHFSKQRLISRGMEFFSPFLPNRTSIRRTVPGATRTSRTGPAHPSQCIDFLLQLPVALNGIVAHLSLSELRLSNRCKGTPVLTELRLLIVGVFCKQVCTRNLDHQRIAHPTTLHSLPGNQRGTWTSCSCCRSVKKQRTGTGTGLGVTTLLSAPVTSTPFRAFTSRLCP